MSRPQPSPLLPSRRRCAGAAAAAASHRLSRSAASARCFAASESGRLLPCVQSVSHALPPAATPLCLQTAAGKKGGAAPRGFTDHNAKWLKPKQRQEEPSSEEDEEEGLSDEELSLSGEEFSDDDSEGPLGSDGARGARLLRRCVGGWLSADHFGMSQKKCGVFQDRMGLWCL